MQAKLILTVGENVDPTAIDGKTFQLHIVAPGVVRLYPVEIAVSRRCPVLIAGERCGEPAGHDGKHQWASGD